MLYTMKIENDYNGQIIKATQKVKVMRSKAEPIYNLKVLPTASGSINSVYNEKSS